MRRRGAIVWLDLDFEAVWLRIADSSRPLARNRRVVEELFKARREAYRDCDLRVGCGGLAAPVLAAEIDRWLREERLG
jgi:shikimate kinase